VSISAHEYNFIKVNYKQHISLLMLILTPESLLSELRYTVCRIPLESDNSGNTGGHDLTNTCSLSTVFPWDTSCTEASVDTPFL